MPHPTPETINSIDSAVTHIVFDSQLRMTRNSGAVLSAEQMNMINKQSAQDLAELRKMMQRLFG